MWTCSHLDGVTQKQLVIDIYELLSKTYATITTPLRIYVQRANVGLLNGSMESLEIYSNKYQILCDIQSIRIND